MEQGRNNPKLNTLKSFWEGKKLKTGLSPPSYTLDIRILPLLYQSMDIVKGKDATMSAGRGDRRGKPQQLPEDIL